MTYRVLLLGGESGGHVYPLVAVARALQAQATITSQSIELQMMGDGPYVARAAKEAGITYHRVLAPKLRRYASAGNILDIFKVPVALVQSLFRLLIYMPDVVFAKGGASCVFPTLAARLYRIPVYLHESDSVPGLANRILARRAKLVFTAFANADQYFKQINKPTMLVGNPFRLALGAVQHDKALEALKLVSDKKTILIIGGSQGAAQLNELVLNGLVQLVTKGYQIVHQAGEKNFDEVKKAVEQYMTEGGGSYAPLIAAQYRVYPFLNENEMATAYGAADVVITRASAGGLTEVSYLGKPMIVVPLAGSANDHQMENAAELAKFGAVVVDGANMTPQIVLAQLERLLEPTTYAKASQDVRAFARPDAAEKIAKVLLEG